MKGNIVETRLTPITQTGIASILPESINTRLATRDNMKILRSAHQEAIHDQCRALLAQSVLEHTAVLSAMEVQCSRTAPMGEIRYQKIVDSYVAGAIARIVRW